jgi:hypothetical protein
VFCRQPTQLPLEPSHSGVAPPHCEPFLAEHCEQLPSAWQAGADGWPLQSASVAQATHPPVVGSHAGAWSGQSPFERHPTHRPMVALQRSDAPHCEVLLDEHWPQAPPGWQAGVPAWPAQPVSLVQATQLWVPRSHAGAD